MIRYFYFGCINDVGHYLIDLNGTQLRYVEAAIPWDCIDSVLCPGMIKWREHWIEASNGPGQVEGLASLHHKDGWTALSFWDRSVDDRYGSNSNFFINVELDWDDMIEECKATWPNIWKRFKFEIKQYIPMEELHR
jgi:hypothetical protein